MRPSSERSPGAQLNYRLGTQPGVGPDSPPDPSCCDVDPDNVPDRAAEENGATAVKLSTPTLTGIVQADSVGTQQVDALSILDFPATAQDGNQLYAVHLMRAGGPGTWPSGWTNVKTISISGFGGGTMEVRVANVEDVDPNQLVITKGGSFATWLAFAEIPQGAVVDFEFTENPGTSPSAMSVGPATVADDDSLALVVWAVPGINETITGDGDFIDLETGEATPSPTGLLEYAVVAAGPLSATASSGSAIDNWGAILVVFPPGGSAPGWIVPVPTVIDEDPSTYTTITGPELVRLDLGAAYRIQRTLVRIGTTNAGVATLSLYGANEADYSDAVLAREIDFTATGSLTLQDVTDEWYTTASYRYWQLDGPAEVVRVATWSLFQGTAEITVQHPASMVTYDDTDTSLPGTPTNVQDAIEAIVDLITGAAISRPLMAQDPATDLWYVVVDGDGTAVMVPG